MTATLGWFARQEAAVLLLALGVVLGVWAFVQIADVVREGERQSVDDAVLRLFRRADDPARPVGPGWLVDAAHDVSALGGPAVLTLAVLAVTGYLALLRQWRTVVLLVVAALGGLALSTLLKHLYARPRPAVVPSLAPVVTASFPSGHSMLAAVVYLTLGALLATVVVVISALAATAAPPSQIVDAWGRGFWELIPFTLQMSLIIITGHVLAVSPPMQHVIRVIAGWPSTPRRAVAMVAFFAMASSWFNWGFSLVFSAVLAREVARRVEGVERTLQGATEDVGRAGNDRDVSRARIAFQAACRFPAVQVREREIHHDQVGVLVERHTERGGAVRHRLHAKAFAEQHARVDLARVRVIFGDDDERWTVGGRPSRSGHERQSTASIR